MVEEMGYVSIVHIVDSWMPICGLLQYVDVGPGPNSHTWGAVLLSKVSCRLVEGVVEFQVSQRLSSSPSSGPPIISFLPPTVNWHPRSKLPSTYMGQKLWSSLPTMVRVRFSANIVSALPDRQKRRHPLTVSYKARSSRRSWLVLSLNL